MKFRGEKIKIKSWLKYMAQWACINPLYIYRGEVGGDGVHPPLV